MRHIINTMVMENFFFAPLPVAVGHRWRPITNPLSTYISVGIMLPCCGIPLKHGDPRGALVVVLGV